MFRTVTDPRTWHLYKYKKKKRWGGQVDLLPDHVLSFTRHLHMQSCHRLCQVLVSQLCLTLCNPMDCSSLDSCVHEILQGRILEWAAVPFSRVSSWPRDRTCVSCITGKFFTIWATREVINSSVLAWRIPGMGSLVAAIYGVAQSRTRLKVLSSSKLNITVSFFQMKKLRLKKCSFSEVMKLSVMKQGFKFRLT